MTEKITTVRVFTGRTNIIVDDEFHEVTIYIPGMKLKKGIGYIKGEHVYVYKGKVPEDFKQGEKLEAGIWKDREGNYIFVEYDKETAKKYHIDNVNELNLDKIFKEMETSKDSFIDAEDIEVINNNTELWLPTIKEDDDFLKYLVKRIIIDKKVNLKNYKSKFTNQHALNNLKSGLIKNTKMTVKNFKIWCEILGVRWDMIIEDNGTDKINPLPNPIHLSSEEFL